MKKEWLSIISSFGYLDAEITNYEAEGWTFHSFSCYDVGCVVLFWRQK